MIVLVIVIVIFKYKYKLYMEEFFKEYFNMWGNNCRHDFYCEEGITQKINKKN